MLARLARLFLRADERLLASAMGPLEAQLATCRAELLASERALADLKGRLDHWIGQAIRARAERDRAERERDQAAAVLVQALTEREALTERVLAIEEELTRLERSQENLTEIAESYRDQLRELRAAVTIGAAQRKGRR